MKTYENLYDDNFWQRFVLAIGPFYLMLRIWKPILEGYILYIVILSITVQAVLYILYSRLKCTYTNFSLKSKEEHDSIWLYPTI